MGTSLWPPLMIKKKCMFGKDERPDRPPQFFSGWVTDSGSSTSSWTTTGEYRPQYNAGDFTRVDDD